MKNLITIIAFIILHVNVFSQSTLQPNSLQLTYDTSDGETTLIWTTTNEQNSSYFRIEKSTDGTNFEAVASVKAITGSGKSHQYAYTTIEQLNAIYRVVLVSMEGLSFVSNTLPVINDMNETQRGLATK